MGRVVLARRVNGGSKLGGPPEVHAYRVPDSPDAAPETWVSPCGERAKADEVEIVEAFSGAPCMTCFMIAVMGSDVAPVTREELEAPPVRQPELKAPEEVIIFPPSGDLFAVSWRGKVLHRIAPDAPHTAIDGRPLVLALCNALAWGPPKPIAAWEPEDPFAPEEYDFCDQCEELNSGARA